MERLERTRSGNFKAEDAYRLSELEVFAKEGSLEERLLPVESVFEQLDAYQVQGGRTEAFRKRQLALCRFGDTLYERKKNSGSM